MARWKAVSRWVLAVLMVAAGILHFVFPAFYRKMMPPYLPMHAELVAISGVCEIVLGVLLLTPRFRRLAAWGVVALLIAVFPANIHIFQNQQLFPAPPAAHVGRLLLQGVLILWAYWHTRPDATSEDRHAD